MMNCPISRRPAEPTTADGRKSLDCTTLNGPRADAVKGFLREECRMPAGLVSRP
jgi:hypothetical protein